VPRGAPTASTVTKSPVIQDYCNYPYNPTYLKNENEILPYKHKEDDEKKREKKWTLGGFFRRKSKKEADESSEEEEDQKKGFLQRKRSNRNKGKSRTNGFDVVVSQLNTPDAAKTAEELWVGQKEPQQRYIFRQHDVRTESNLSRNSSGGSGSLDSRKGRREVMARAQAKRDQMRDGSSSDDNGSGHSTSSITREGRRRRPGRPKIPSATPSPSRSPRVQHKMPLHASSSYPLPVHTYPPGYHWDPNQMNPHRRTLHEYEQFMSMCGNRNKSLSFDHDMHRAEAMFVQLPIARTKSSCIQAEAHGQVPNMKPDPPPRMRPNCLVNSTSSLPIQANQHIQRSFSGNNYFDNMYENVNDPYQYKVGSHQHIYQNFRLPNSPNAPTKATVHYSQSHPNPVYYQNGHSPNLPSSPPADLRYYADLNPRSRNPIHITCHTNPSPTNDSHPYLSDSQISRKSTKDFWRQKDKELMLQMKQQGSVNHTSKTDRSRSNSPTMKGVVNCPKQRQTAIVTARKIVHGVTSNFEPMKPPARPQSPLVTKLENPVLRTISPPAPPVRRHSKIDIPINFSIKEEGAPADKSTSNLDDALNELESIYKSLGLSEDHSTPVKSQKPSPRRSPDRVLDDMAVRRLTVKENVEIKQLLTPSYLECSPVLGSTPRQSPIPASAKSGVSPEPDITLDDVVFRNHRHANSSLKTLEPQPLFGIPLGPVAPASNSDYLHVNPVDKLRHSYIASKVPDVVKDDLAFRNLRKDNLTSNLPPFPQSVGPKKRAVRSMSENLYNLMQTGDKSFLPIETNNNVEDFDKTQSMSDLNENIQRDNKILEKRLKALKDEKIAKRAEFFDDKLNAPVQSWSEMKQSHSAITYDASRQRSTSTETLTEDPELRQIREGMQKKSGECKLHPPPAPERKHFRSPVVELSKFPAAVPATALQQNPFRVEPPSLDDAQLDDLLSKIAWEAKRTSEVIGRQLVELEVAAATDLLSPEKKALSRLSSIETELRKQSPTIAGESEKSKDEIKIESPVYSLETGPNLALRSKSENSISGNSIVNKSHEKDSNVNNVVKIRHANVQPPPVTLKVSFTSNLSQILQEVEEEHKALCADFPDERKCEDSVTKHEVKVTPVQPLETYESNSPKQKKEVVTNVTKTENGILTEKSNHSPSVNKRERKSSSSSSRKSSLEGKPTFEPISDVSEILDSEDLHELTVDNAKVDVFEEVYEYNCTRLKASRSKPGKNGPEAIAVNDEVKKVLLDREKLSRKDSSDEVDGSDDERGASNGVVPRGSGENSKMQAVDQDVWFACAYALALLPAIQQLDFLTALGIVLAVISIFALLML